MVSVERVSKSYGSKLALDGLSLTVEPGTVLGFIGPNGAGKTTAMRIVSGAMPPSSGKVSIRGFAMEDEPLKAKALIGYLPENAPLYAHMRVRPFLEFCARMRGVPERKLQEAVELASARCVLQSVEDEELDSLSKGFRRRVCLAQAIIHEPEVLLLDEPTDGLDPVQKTQMRKLVEELKPGRAIIVSTHILEEVDAVCDRVVAIAKGKKIFDGPTAAFKAAGRGVCFDIALSGTLPPSLAVETLGALPETKIAELESQAGEICVVRLHLKSGASEGRLSVDAIDAARASGWQVEKCERVQPERLDDVFTALVAAESEKGSEK